MNFINPAWLWALSGLALPIGIHLLSRKEGKVIYMGSLRYLDESDTKQFRALKLNELLLLIIRCLLITWIVFLLAGITIERTTTSNTRWIITEPNLSKDPALTLLTDSLTRQGYETHYLADGFPTTYDTSKKTFTNTWALLEQIKGLSLADIVVLSHSQIKNFIGIRTPLPATIKWITVDSRPEEFVLAARRISTDSIIIRTTKSTGTETIHDYEKIRVPPDQSVYTFNSDAVNIRHGDTVFVTLAYDQQFNYDATIVGASVAAIREIPMSIIKINKTETKNYKPVKSDWLIWLSERPLPLPDTFNSIALKYTPSAAAVFVQRGAQIPYQKWEMNQRLTMDLVLQQNSTLELASIILNNHESEYDATKADLRTLPESFLKPLPVSENHSQKEHVQTTNLDQFMILLILITLLIERLLAYQRNQ